MVAGLMVAGLMAAGMTGCTGSTEDAGEENVGPAVARGEPMTLDVLVFNIEYEGGQATDKVIERLDADVVGVLESYDRLPEIAAKTGYEFYNVGLQILSHYPIHEPSGAEGLYALIEVQPGYVVAMFNIHLDYVRYGPRLLARGTPVAEVLDSEDEVRTSSLRFALPRMQDLAERGYPVVLTGDFNQPSSLDYSAKTVGTRPGVTEPIAWPVSEALFGIGFRDTYREVHPDPVEVPGITMADPDFRKGGQGDRIDFVYAGGPSTTQDSRLVGEPGGADVDVPFRPWTSDHRAVLSTLELAPVALSTTVSLTSRMLTRGDPLGVYVNAPADGNALEVRTAAGEVLPKPGRSDLASAVALSLPTAELEPGGYDVVLLDAAGEELAHNEFWLRSEVAGTTLSTDKRTYAVDEPITVTWANGPANRWDWIGVYRAGASDPDTDDYLVWGYTGGHDSGALPPTVSGSIELGEGSQGSTWPLPPGEYVAHYLLADRYDSAGTTQFVVTPG